MPFYGAWRPGLIHTYRWNALGGSGGRIYLTNNGTPHPGITSPDSDDRRGGAWYSKKPIDPRAYSNPSIREAVYTEARSGLFEANYSPPPGNEPGEAGLNGTDAWVGGTSSPNGQVMYKFDSLSHPPAFVGDIQASGFRTRLQARSYTFRWLASSAQPNQGPQLADWPEGAVGVDFMPGGQVEFIEAIIEPTITYTTAPGSFVAGPVTPVLGYTYPDSGLWKSRTFGSSQIPDGPAAFRSVPLVSGETEIPNFDEIRNYWPTTSGQPNHDKETSLIIAPSGFLVGTAPDPAQAPEPAANSEIGYGVNLTSIFFRITFRTNSYRFIYDEPPQEFVGVLKAQDPDTGEWLWEGKTSQGRFKVLVDGVWKYAEPVSGENGGFGVLKVKLPDGTWVPTRLRGT